MTLPASAGVVGDTISSQANLSEVFDIMYATAESLELEFATMRLLVTEHNIPRGSDRIRIPFQDSTFVVQAHTDGDEVSTSQRFTIDTIDLTTTELVIPARLTDRALRFSTVDIAAMAGEELAKAKAERIEADLLSTLNDTGTVDLGAAGANTNLGHVRDARALLYNVARSQGGPAKTPIALVINPIQEAHLLTDIGVAAASTTFVRPLQDPTLVTAAYGIEGYMGNLLGIPVYRSGYIDTTVQGVTTPDHGGMFSKHAIHLGISKDWDLKFFEEDSWIGIIMRAHCDYGFRVGAFPQWVVQFDTDTATL